MLHILLKLQYQLKTTMCCNLYCCRLLFLETLSWYVLWYYKRTYHATVCTYSIMYWKLKWNSQCHSNLQTWGILWRTLMWFISHVHFSLCAGIHIDTESEVNTFILYQAVPLTPECWWTPINLEDRQKTFTMSKSIRFVCPVAFPSVAFNFQERESKGNKNKEHNLRFCIFYKKVI